MDEEKIRQEAFAEGWRACLTALGAAMAANPAPFVPPAKPPKRPAPGSDIANVLLAIETWPGLPTLQVVERVLSQWPHIAEGSARVALTRLHQKRLIRSEEDKWFPAQAG